MNKKLTVLTEAAKLGAFAYVTVALVGATLIQGTKTSDALQALKK